MKRALENKKILIIIAFVIMLLLLLGISFAYFTTELSGEKEYQMKVGSLSLDLQEDNELVLEKSIPLRDSEGKKLQGYSFSIKNNARIDNDYTIYLDDIPLASNEKLMPNSAIKYSLVKGSKETVGSFSSLTGSPNRVLDSGVIKASEKINYTLKIWINYDATKEEAGGKTFKGKLRIEASQVYNK